MLWEIKVLLLQLYFLSLFLNQQTLPVSCHPFQFK